MEEFESFLVNRFEELVKLKEKFQILEKKQWDALTVLLELGLQISHINTIFDGTEAIVEDGRAINDIGDELSDVLLQLLYFSHLTGIALDDIEGYDKFTYAEPNGFVILYGQLVEAVLEAYEYRFPKDRKGFETIYAFIKDRLIKLCLIVFNYAKENNIDMIAEFDRMNQDATNFINKKIAAGETYGDIRKIR